MTPSIRALRSSAPFWSVRYHEEKRETLAMRQDTLEPPRLSVDRGAMLSAVVEGGYGYCATSDLSTAGLQKALDRATRWAQECKHAKIDERIVERQASIELIEDERVYLTNTGGELRQRFRYTVPHMRVAANQGKDTQVRSLDHAQQGGFEQIERSGFIGSGRRLGEQALQLLTAPNCPSGQMDVLLMPDQMMIQIHESI